MNCNEVLEPLNLYYPMNESLAARENNNTQTCHKVQISD